MPTHEERLAARQAARQATRRAAYSHTTHTVNNITDPQPPFTQTPLPPPAAPVPALITTPTYTEPSTPRESLAATTWALPATSSPILEFDGEYAIPQTTSQPTMIEGPPMPWATTWPNPHPRWDNPPQPQFTSAAGDPREYRHTLKYVEIEIRPMSWGPSSYCVPTNFHQVVGQGEDFVFTGSLRPNPTVNDWALCLMMEGKIFEIGTRINSTIIRVVPTQPAFDAYLYPNPTIAASLPPDMMDLIQE
ncbi:hypothetical protein DFH08DRAFT_813706 [Mycena albidolilacea]|uniref:Uncharacterized protein n=1 Tax=Mycena albidolilacea TaxID=1033008 RepID=A0AAD6ZRY5_9AGAR|nr:hypothetical protein DFH08DRAFT_813706 [Mycena albidolilacea]